MSRASQLPPERHRTRWLLGVASAICVGLAAVVVILLLRPSPVALDHQLHPPSASADAAQSSFMRGTYHHPIYRAAAAGERPRIDARATVAALRSANIDTYAYLIWPDRTEDPQVSRTQWEDLPAFAGEAAAAGIDVYVYLVPPTEAPVAAYQPFGWDYIAWAEATGILAAQQPAIRGIMIDDFGGNTFARPSNMFVFSPDYVRRMMSAARKHAAWLTFMPVLYHHDIVGPRAVLADYRQFVDAVVFPYHGASDGKTVPGNTRDASLAYGHGAEVARRLRCEGPTPCTQFVFPPRSAGDPTTDAAAIGTQVRFVPQTSQSLIFTVESTLDQAAGQDHLVEVWVDGVKRATPIPIRGSDQYQVSLDTLVGRSTQADTVVEVRIRRRGPWPRTKLAVTLDNLQISGSAAPRWTAGSSADVRIEETATIPLIYMTYAIPLQAEQGKGAAPEYVAAVLTSIDRLRREGMVDGSLVFNLPLDRSTPDDRAKYQLVAQTYARWQKR